MKLYLLDADYFDDDKQSVIRLFCKDKKGNTVVCLDYNFSPYFYILPAKGKAKELKKKVDNIISVRIKKSEFAERIISGEKKKLLKISCFSSKDVKKTRDIVKRWKGLVENEYEYSINFYKRYLIDKQIEGWIDVEGKEVREKYRAGKVMQISKLKPADSKEMPTLKLMAFDIETVEENGKQKIIMLSLKSKNFECVLAHGKLKPCKNTEVLESEAKVLERFASVIEEQDPDVLLGFNSDEFDSQIIQNRAEDLDVKLKISRNYKKLKFVRRARISTARFKGLVHIDLYQFIKNILATQLQTEVLTLDAVSAELIGEKKIDVSYGDIIKSWKKGKDLEKIAQYCLKDSELTLKLGEFILPQIYEMSRITGQLLFDTSRMMYSQLVEWYLSRRAFEMKNIIPNQPNWTEIGERRQRKAYAGGFVKEPIGGLHEKIAVMDFRSLYPSIIATFNISPETLNCPCCKGYRVPERDYWFCKKKKGFVSTVIKDIIERRGKLKLKKAKSKKESNRLNNEQLAVKTISNATYGYFGFSGSKWYCYECAESAAAFGRFYIKKVIDEAEKEGFIVVYGDTDSLFVKTDGSIKSKVDKFLKKINKYLPGIIKLNLQGIYKRGLFIPKDVGPGTAKKKYALIDDKGVLTIRGLEKVRRDWSNVAKDTQEKVLKLILEKEDVKGSIKYVKETVKKLKGGDIPLNDLVIIEQLTKPLKEYKRTSPHVSAAMKMKERGKQIGIGMPILFVIAKGNGSISERAEPFEDVSIEDVDIDYYINNQILPASMRVLKVLKVKEEDIL